jgi:hypothetical protein
VLIGFDARSNIFARILLLAYRINSANARFDPYSLQSLLTLIIGCLLVASPLARILLLASLLMLARIILLASLLMLACMLASILFLALMVLALLLPITWMLARYDPWLLG